ncbi:OB-fold nucleic acid binding domain-containing protein [Streptacidiphilus carbonis]|uniref:OB-fold nucleic acid binding domain-containing protein n=1 Tax=Streptacidiphilus carbonis TaxID=105422 RepID=UPI0005A686A4|nr:OB-fold nucleic acid binding domain-containing protein [Streptacidiphilus carbonis]
MSGDLATETVADLVASGRIAGEAQISGTVTSIDARRNKAENEWAIVALDDGTGVIEVLAFPKNWTAIKPHLQVGKVATLTGRLNHNSRTGRLELYATGLVPTAP